MPARIIRRHFPWQVLLTLVLTTVCGTTLVWGTALGRGAEPAGSDPSAVSDQHDSLGQLIEQARGKFTPPADEQKQVAIAQLDKSVDRLGDYLNTGTENARAWKRYLEWPQLEALVAHASDANAEEIAARLRPLQRLRGARATRVCRRCIGA
ncbi:MAG: hypothetical protein R3C10_09525 [Pirellulales bacterium]